MAFKYFGKLAGTTITGNEALKDNSPPSRRTPFNVQAPCTKFLAYGEPATSRAFNRLAGALSSNIDYLAATLDTPSIRTQVLSYFKEFGVKDDVTVSSYSGFPGLVLGNPDTATATTNPATSTFDGSDSFEINLAAADAATGKNPPAVWLYVGTDRRRLGSTLTAVREDAKKYQQATAGGGSADNNRASLEYTHRIEPLYVRPKAGKDPYHTSGGVLGLPDSHLDVPYRPVDDPLSSIPPILEVAEYCELAPYGDGWNGLNQVSKYETDGLVIATEGNSDVSWEDQYARPGCYAYVKSGVHRGLYLIRSVTNSKVVLTRGSLSKVTVTTPANFTAGQRVSWSTASYASAGLQERPNKGYVVFKDGSDVYLLNFSSTEDRSTETNPGSLVSTRHSSALAAGHTSHKTNDFGMPDSESGVNNVGWTMPVGTRLYYNDDNTDSDVVTAVVGPNEPVSFNPATSPSGHYVTLCSPVGFLLNPRIGFSKAVAPTYIPGNYVLEAKTLTTVREKLNSSAVTVGYDSAEDEGLPLSREPHYLSFMGAQAEHLRNGYFSSEVNSPYDPLNAPGVPTALRTLWRTGGTKNILGADGHLLKFGTAPTVSVGRRYTILHPTVNSANSEYVTTGHFVTATVAAKWGNWVLFRGVVREFGNRAQSDLFAFPSFVAGTTTTNASYLVDSTTLDNHIVTEVYSPKLGLGKGSDPIPETPTLSLDSVFRGLFDAAPEGRDRPEIHGSINLYTRNNAVAAASGDSDPARPASIQLWKGKTASNIAASFIEYNMEGVTGVTGSEFLRSFQRPSTDHFLFHSFIKDTDGMANPGMPSLLADHIEDSSQTRAAHLAIKDTSDGAHLEMFSESLRLDFGLRATKAQNQTGTSFPKVNVKGPVSTFKWDNGELALSNQREQLVLEAEDPADAGAHRAKIRWHDVAQSSSSNSSVLGLASGSDVVHLQDFLDDYVGTADSDGFVRPGYDARSRASLGFTTPKEQFLLTGDITVKTGQAGISGNGTDFLNELRNRQQLRGLISSVMVDINPPDGQLDTLTTTITGTGTQFTQDLTPGMVITYSGSENTGKSFLVVGSIVSDTEMVVTQAPSASITSLPFYKVVYGDTLRHNTDNFGEVYKVTSASQATLKYLYDDGSLVQSGANIAGGSASKSGTTLTGSGTSFLAHFNVGDYITLNYQITDPALQVSDDGTSIEVNGVFLWKIASVDTDTSITLEQYSEAINNISYTNVAYRKVTGVGVPSTKRMDRRRTKGVLTFGDEMTSRLFAGVPFSNTSRVKHALGQSAVITAPTGVPANLQHGSVLGALEGLSLSTDLDSTLPHSVTSNGVLYGGEVTVLNAIGAVATFDPHTVGSAAFTKATTGLTITNATPQGVAVAEVRKSIKFDISSLKPGVAADYSVQPPEPGEQLVATVNLNALTGTVSTTGNNSTVTGTGTKFLSEVLANSFVTLAGVAGQFKVKAIQSDTSLTLYSNPSAATDVVMTSTGLHSSTTANSNFYAEIGGPDMSDVYWSRLNTGVSLPVSEKIDSRTAQQITDGVRSPRIAGLAGTNIIKGSTEDVSQAAIDAGTARLGVDFASEFVVGDHIVVAYYAGLARSFEITAITNASTLEVTPNIEVSFGSVFDQNTQQTIADPDQSQALQIYKATATEVSLTASAVTANDVVPGNYPTAEEVGDRKLLTYSPPTSNDTPLFNFGIVEKGMAVELTDSNGQTFTSYVRKPIGNMKLLLTESVPANMTGALTARLTVKDTIWRFNTRPNLGNGTPALNGYDGVTTKYDVTPLYSASAHTKVFLSGPDKPADITNADMSDVGVVISTDPNNHGLQTTDVATINGTGAPANSGVNGTHSIQKLTNTFLKIKLYLESFVPDPDALVHALPISYGAGGTLGENATVVQTSSAHQLSVGDTVPISGNAAIPDGNYVVTDVVDGDEFKIAGSYTGAGGNVEVSHGLSTGDKIYVASTGGTINGVFVVTVIDSNEFYFDAQINAQIVGGSFFQTPTVSVSAAAYTFKGHKYELPEMRLDVSGLNTLRFYILANPANDTYSVTNNPEVANSLGIELATAGVSQIPIAEIETVVLAPNIVSITRVKDIRYKTCSVDRKTSIIVGRVGPSPDLGSEDATDEALSNSTHFSSLYRAFSAIESWKKHAPSLYEGKHWHIRVLGSTKENRPLRVPVDGIIVEGTLADFDPREPEKANNTYSGIEFDWTYFPTSSMDSVPDLVPGDTLTRLAESLYYSTNNALGFLGTGSPGTVPLIDINGKSNVVFKNLAFNFSSSTGPVNEAGPTSISVDTRGNLHKIAVFGSDALGTVQFPYYRKQTLSDGTLVFDEMTPDHIYATTVVSQGYSEVHNVTIENCHVVRGVVGGFFASQYRNVGSVFRPPVSAEDTFLGTLRELGTHGKAYGGYGLRIKNCSATTANVGIKISGKTAPLDRTAEEKIHSNIIIEGCSFKRMDRNGLYSYKFSYVDSNHDHTAMQLSENTAIYVESSEHVVVRDNYVTGTINSQAVLPSGEPVITLNDSSDDFDGTYETDPTSSGTSNDGYEMGVWLNNCFYSKVEGCLIDYVAYTNGDSYQSTAAGQTNVWDTYLGTRAGIAVTFGTNNSVVGNSVKRTQVDVDLSSLPGHNFTRNPSSSLYNFHGIFVSSSDALVSGNKVGKDSYIGRHSVSDSPFVDSADVYDDPGIRAAIYGSGIVIGDEPDFGTPSMFKKFHDQLAQYVLIKSLGTSRGGAAVTLALDPHQSATETVKPIARNITVSNNHVRNVGRHGVVVGFDGSLGTSFGDPESNQYASGLFACYPYHPSVAKHRTSAYSQFTDMKVQFLRGVRPQGYNSSNAMKSLNSPARLRTDRCGFTVSDNHIVQCGRLEPKFGGHNVRGARPGTGYCGVGILSNTFNGLTITGNYIVPSTYRRVTTSGIFGSPALGAALSGIFCYWANSTANRPPMSGNISGNTLEARNGNRGFASINLVGVSNFTVANNVFTSDSPQINPFTGKITLDNCEDVSITGNSMSFGQIVVGSDIGAESLSSAGPGLGSPLIDFGAGSYLVEEELDAEGITLQSIQHNGTSVLWGPCESILLTGNSFRQGGARAGDGVEFSFAGRDSVYLGDHTASLTGQGYRSYVRGTMPRYGIVVDKGSKRVAVSSNTLNGAAMLLRGSDHVITSNITAGGSINIASDLKDCIISDNNLYVSMSDVIPNNTGTSRDWDYNSKRGVINIVGDRLSTSGHVRKNGELNRPSGNRITGNKCLHPPVATRDSTGHSFMPASDDYDGATYSDVYPVRGMFLTTNHNFGSNVLAGNTPRENSKTGYEQATRLVMPFKESKLTVSNYIPGTRNSAGDDETDIDRQNAASGDKVGLYTVPGLWPIHITEDAIGGGQDMPPDNYGMPVRVAEWHDFQAMISGSFTYPILFKDTSSSDFKYWNGAVSSNALSRPTFALHDDIGVKVPFVGATPPYSSRPLDSSLAGIEEILNGSVFLATYNHFALQSGSANHDWRRDEAVNKFECLKIFIGHHSDHGYVTTAPTANVATRDSNVHLITGQEGNHNGLDAWESYGTLDIDIPAQYIREGWEIHHGIVYYAVNSHFQALAYDLRDDLLDEENNKTSTTMTGYDSGTNGRGDTIKAKAIFYGQPLATSVAGAHGTGIASASDDHNDEDTTEGTGYGHSREATARDVQHPARIQFGLQAVRTKSLNRGLSSSLRGVTIPSSVANENLALLGPNITGEGSELTNFTRLPMASYDKPGTVVSGHIKNTLQGTSEARNLYFPTKLDAAHDSTVRVTATPGSSTLIVTANASEVAAVGGGFDTGTRIRLGFAEGRYKTVYTVASKATDGSSIAITPTPKIDEVTTDLHVYITHLHAASDTVSGGKTMEGVGTLSYANAVLSLNPFYANRVLDPISRHERASDVPFLGQEDMGLNASIHGELGLHNSHVGYSRQWTGITDNSVASTAKANYENYYIHNGFKERVAHPGVMGGLFCRNVSLRGLEDFSFRINIKSSIHTNRFDESTYVDERLQALDATGNEDGGSYITDATQYGRTRYLRWYSGAISLLGVELVLVPPDHVRFTDGATYNSALDAASDWHPDKSDGDIS